MHVLGFVTLLSLVHVCPGQLPACYYSDGSPATNDVPCDPDASNSACCGRTAICETNLYCQNENGARAFGSCTDPTWQSDDCPLPLPQPLGGFSFQKVTNCSDGTFCPNSNNQSCCDNNQGIEMIYYSNTATIPIDLSAYYANGGYSIPATASTHSSSASNSLSMTITGATSASAVPTSTGPAITTTASPTSSTAMKTSQTSPSSSTSSSSSSGLSKGASAGVGVGSALGVLIIGVAVILFIHKRKRKKGVVERYLSGTMMEPG